MGIISKLKGIFYDEVEVDEEEVKKVEHITSTPVKKEESKIEEKPKIEEIKYKPKEKEEPVKVEEKKEDNGFNERDLFRSERTFNFTEFDNDEEEVIPQRRNVLVKENKTAKVENPTIPETPKVFKPSPIISPIYGILDKDYKKEEIKSKEQAMTPKITANLTTYDTVRRKAYGTLEEELEDTLNSINKITPDTIHNEEVKETRESRLVKEEPKVVEKKKPRLEELLTKIEDATEELDKTLPIGVLEDRVKLENFDDEDEGVSDKTITDTTLEHDLFNLIDSMYDDKED